MNNFTVVGTPPSSFIEWFVENMKDIFQRKGFRYEEQEEWVAEPIKLVYNVLDPQRIRPYRRKAQATFVASIIESTSDLNHPFEEAYPYLIRSLSNVLIFIHHQLNGSTVYFVTPEQGFYSVSYDKHSDKEFFQKIYERLEPLATSQMVIDNTFVTDLPKQYWQLTTNTNALREAGKRLDNMNLLPAPFPLEKYLTDRDIRHIKKLYGLGGLSYGNLSVREKENEFWMSASGIDKGKMEVVGEDMLYIKNYDDNENCMVISVPPNTNPKRASVDAIEHWMIYKEHPEVGAIVHVHAWINDVEATEMNYPCGTIELAKSVAELVRRSPNPAQAVVGLKNHGLTITGYSLEDIFSRIENKIEKQVPMS